MIIGTDEIDRYVKEAVSVTPGERNANIILLCEHGGRRVPAAWNNLGLPEAFLDTHFGFDIGSRNLTLAVAAKLEATAVVAEYSRLFLDYNRKQHDPSCIRPDMGGIPIPMNLDVSGDERELRERIARKPVEEVVRCWVEGDEPAKAVVSIHSFSPVWETVFRMCQIGVMWKQDDRLSLPLIQAIREVGVYTVDDNMPYSFKENDWFTLDRHGIAAGVPNAYIEVRNDLIGDAALVEKTSKVLVAAIERACASL